MPVNYDAILGRGGGGSPAPVGGSTPNYEAILGRAGNSWNLPALRAADAQQAANDRVQSLNDIGAGKSSLNYSDQINTINQAATDGIIQKSDQMNLIHAAGAHDAVKTQQQQQDALPWYQKVDNAVNDFVGGAVGSAQRVVGTALQGGIAATTIPDFVKGAMGDKQAQAQIQAKLNFINAIGDSKAIDGGSNSFMTPDIISGKASPLEFGKSIVNAGVNASQFIPGAKGATIAGEAAVQGVAATVKRVAAQAGILGGTQTGNQILQGQEVTPLGVAANFGLPLVLGAGHEFGSPIAKGIQTGVDNVRLGKVGREFNAPKATQLQSDVLTPAQVNSIIPKKIGVQDLSNGSQNLGKPMTFDTYQTNLNKLSKAYDTAIQNIQKLPPESRTFAARQVDSRFERQGQALAEQYHSGKLQTAPVASTKPNAKSSLLAVDGAKNNPVLSMDVSAQHGGKQAQTGTVSPLPFGDNVTSGSTASGNPLREKSISTGGGQSFSYLSSKEASALQSHADNLEQSISDMKSGKTAYNQSSIDNMSQQLNGIKAVISGKETLYDVRHGATHIRSGRSGLNPDSVPNGAPTGDSSILAKLPQAAVGDMKAADGANRYVNHAYDTINQKIQAAGAKLGPEDTALIKQIESKTNMTPAQAAQRVEDLSKKAKDPKGFKDAVAALREGYNAIQANDAHLGRDVGRRQNYLARIYQKPAGAAGRALDYLRANNPDKPGYSNSRVIATQSEAEQLAKMKNPDGTQKYPNLQLKNNNVFQDAAERLASAAHDHSEQAIKKALQEAHPGVTIGRGNGGTFDPVSGSRLTNLKLPGAEDLTAPEGIAKAYGNHLNPDVANVKDAFAIKMKDGTIVPVKDNELVQQLKETGGQLIDPATGKSLHSNVVSRAVRYVKNNPAASYDAVNQNLKYSILGGGTFHLFTTGGSVAGQQLMHGLAHIYNPAKVAGIISDNAKLVRGTLSATQHDANMAAHEASGLTNFAHMVGTTLKDKEIAADANSSIVDKFKDNKLNLIKQVHDMVFQRQIPEAKMMLLKQDMEQKFGKNVDYHNPTPEMIKYGQEIASGVNKFGGMNRTMGGKPSNGNWTMSPGVAKWVSRVGLAPDFTEGKFRTIFSALNVAKWGPEQNMARQMIVGKSVLFALPGLIAATAAGKVDWNDPKSWGKAVVDQLLDPNIALDSKGAPTKSNPDGTSQAIHFPSTFISEIGKIVKPALDHMADPNMQPDAASGLKSYLTNRGAAGIGVVSRMIQNKDFFGNPIYSGTDAAGNPLTNKDGSTIDAGQSALNIANQVLPIPLVQGAKAINGQSVRDSLLNVAGLRVSSDPTSASGQHTQAVTDFYNTLGSAQKAKSAVVKSVNNLVASGNINQAKRVASDYNASISSRLQSFRDKYASHYNPAWDKDFKLLNITVTPRAFNSRVKATQQAKDVLSPNY